MELPANREVRSWRGEMTRNYFRVLGKISGICFHVAHHQFRGTELTCAIVARPPSAPFVNRTMYIIRRGASFLFIFPS